MYNFFLAIYVDNKKAAQQVFNLITPEGIKWEQALNWYRYINPKNLFYLFKTFDEFLKNLQSIIDNPAPILQTIEANRNHPKLKNLKRSELSPG